MDEAFRILCMLAVPVFTFVLVVLGYSLIRFRRRGRQPEDGAPIHTHKGLVAAWFLITCSLTLLVIIFPGTTGLLALRAMGMEEPDLVVKVDGMRWGWRVTYPQYGVTTFNNLVLPVDRRVKFEVTSLDILHAFWIPAFRVKIDAVPGMVTMATAKTTETGNPDTDPGFRLQCAELCGLGHALMQAPVRVVEHEEFEEWIEQQAPRR